MPEDDNGALAENATPSYNKELRSVVSGGGSRVRTCESQFPDSCNTLAEPRTFRAEPNESQQVTDSEFCEKCKVAHSALWDQCTSAHEKYASCMPEDLTAVFEAWPTLPDDVKAEILTLAKAGYARKRASA